MVYKLNGTEVINSSGLIVGGGAAFNLSEGLNSISAPPNSYGTVSGYTSGGNRNVSPGENIIDKFPFAADANATDVGDLTTGRYSAAGQQV